MIGSKTNIEKVTGTIANVQLVRSLPSLGLDIVCVLYMVLVPGALLQSEPAPVQSMALLQSNLLRVGSCAGSLAIMPYLQ